MHHEMLSMARRSKALTGMQYLLVVRTSRRQFSNVKRHNCRMHTRIKFRNAIRAVKALVSMEV